MWLYKGIRTSHNVLFAQYSRKTQVSFHYFYNASSCDYLGAHVQECDEEVLKHLVDVRVAYGSSDGLVRSKTCIVSSFHIILLCCCYFGALWL